MGNVAPEVSANDDVPGRTVALVKLLLDLRGDVLLDVVLLKSSRGDIHALLLHLLAHVDVLDDRFGSPAASVEVDVASIFSDIDFSIFRCRLRRVVNASESV